MRGFVSLFHNEDASSKIVMGNLRCALCGFEFVLSSCLVVNGAEHHVFGESDKGKMEGFAQPRVAICCFCFLGLN